MARGDDGTASTALGEAVATKPSATTAAAAEQQQPSPAWSKLLSSYSHLSTLDRQLLENQNQNPKHERLLLFVKANGDCCLEGGVEELMRRAFDIPSIGDPFWALREEEVVTGLSMAEAQAAAPAPPPEQQLPPPPQHPPPPPPTDGETAEAVTADDNYQHQEEAAPVQDLLDSATAASTPSKTEAAAATSTSTTPSPPKRGVFGRMFKSVGRTLDKGFHKLAMKADKKRNADLVTVALYHVKHYKKPIAAQQKRKGSPASPKKKQQQASKTSTTTTPSKQIVNETTPKKNQREDDISEDDDDDDDDDFKPVNQAPFEGHHGDDSSDNDDDNDNHHKTQGDDNDEDNDDDDDVNHDKQTNIDKDDNDDNFEWAEENCLLSCTDSEPLPKLDETKALDASYQKPGISFHLPLVLPPHLLDQEEVFVRVWIRSNAGLLQSTFGASNFLIGSSRRISVGHLRSAIQFQTTTTTTPAENDTEKDEEVINHQQGGVVGIPVRMELPILSPVLAVPDSATTMTSTSTTSSPAKVKENGRNYGDDLFPMGAAAAASSEQSQAALAMEDYGTNNNNGQSHSNAKLLLCITPDLKYPPTFCSTNNNNNNVSSSVLLPLGSSLVDPCLKSYDRPRRRPIPAHTAHHHYRPLDQSYAFEYNNQQQIMTTPLPFSEQQQHLIVTQRITESTIALPLAAAVAQLTANATRVSLAHAETTATIVLSKRHDAAVGEYADCQIGIGFIQLTDLLLPEVVDINSKKNPIPFVQVSWQRPDSVFEVDLMPPSTVYVGVLPAGFHASRSVRFFPKPCPKELVLPGILEQLEQKLPPCGFLLGSLRVRVYMLTAADAGAHGIPGFSPKRGGLLGRKAAVPPPTTDLISSADSNSNTAAGGGLFTEDPSLPPTDIHGDSSFQLNDDVETWECIIPLEDILKRSKGENPVEKYPVRNVKSGQEMAVIGMSITVTMNQGSDVPPNPSSANGGLVSLMGMAPLGTFTPLLDFDPNEMKLDDDTIERNKKLSAMGGFVPHSYIDQHANEIREQDCDFMNARAALYKAAIDQLVQEENDGDGGDQGACSGGGFGMENGNDSDSDDDYNNEGAKGSAAAEKKEKEIPPHQKKVPRSFRPSASRTKIFLSGLPLNLHTTSLNFHVIDTSMAPGQQSSGESHFLTICGVPSYPARGYDNIFNMARYMDKYPMDEDDEEAKEHRTALLGLKCPLGSVSGGLRRLEVKRAELVHHIIGLQQHLEAAVDVFLDKKRKEGRNIYHAPAAQLDVQGLRWKVFEAIQALHHVTWTCAMRRASVFSQTLCAAVSTYLTSLSDPELIHSTRPEIWRKHGYLISYEALLCGAAKELGMMEDASVGVEMLRSVQVVLVPENEESKAQERVTVPCSSHLKWVGLSVDGENDERIITVELGIVSTYLSWHVPALLLDRAAVRFHPVFFSVDVYLRPPKKAKGKIDTSLSAGLLDYDDDDEVVVRQDDTVPKQINKEAFLHLNVYAQLALPTDDNLQEAGMVHPLLEKLHQSMEYLSGHVCHESIVEVAALVHQVGGANVVCCKTGKDRTAMHVTFQQVKWYESFMSRLSAPSAPPPPPPMLSDDDVVTIVDTAAAATTAAKKNDAAAVIGEGTQFDEKVMNMFRANGPFLSLCEKNMGEALYGFTSRQQKYLPPHLQPSYELLRKRGLFSRKGSD